MLVILEFSNGIRIIELIWLEDDAFVLKNVPKRARFEVDVFSLYLICFIEINLNKNKMPEKPKNKM